MLGRMAYRTLLACSLVSLAIIAQTSIARAGDAAPTCTGDCDGNGSVTVSELVQGITVLLGSALVLLLPITINGLGTCQAAFVWSFGTVGVGAADAFALSVLFLALGIVGNLPGGVLYATGGLRPARILNRSA